MRFQPALRVALLATVMLSLSGCSVVCEGVTGLMVSNGSVVALVRTCPDVTASDIHLTSLSGPPALDSPVWTFDASDEVKADLGSVKDFLHLIGDVKQGLQPTVSSGVGGYMVFGASDIGSLKDGMILASTQTKDEHVVVDRQGFKDLLASTCE